MPTYYLETSALYKRYHAEPGSEVVHELFDGKQDGELFATSHLTALEFYAVAARMLAGRLLRPRQYERLILRFLNDLTAYDVRILPVNGAIVDDAIDLYPRRPLRAADAVHFATAASVSRAVAPDQFYLVSGDRDIGTTASTHGLFVLDPQAPNALMSLRRIRRPDPAGEVRLSGENPRT